MSYLEDKNFSESDYGNITVLNFLQTRSQLSDGRSQLSSVSRRTLINSLHEKTTDIDDSYFDSLTSASRCNLNQQLYDKLMCNNLPYDM